MQTLYKYSHISGNTLAKFFKNNHSNIIYSRKREANNSLAQQRIAYTLKVMQTLMMIEMTIIVHDKYRSPIHPMQRSSSRARKYATIYKAFEHFSTPRI